MAAVQAKNTVDLGNTKVKPASATEDASLPTWTPPNLTIKDVLSCIPAHCYERSFFRSMLYVVWDFILIGTLVTIVYKFGIDGKGVALVESLTGLKFGPWASWALGWAGWNLYAYCGGLPGTGIWVLAHECGHQAFSSSKFANNAVGLVLHSALLVPYHSWRISHGKHHAATGHLTRDQVHVPKTRSQLGLPSIDSVEEKKRGMMETEGWDKLAKEQQESLLEKASDLFEETPIWCIIELLIQQLGGWPAYLMMNASGQVSYPAWTNHFDPASIIFDARHRQQIILSDVALLVCLGLLGTWGYFRGFAEVFKVYFMPWFWVNHWLVLITYLQHTDPAVPHYREGEWNFQRGALCTVDRNIHGFFFHGIAETHVAHHVSSKIPHYHAWDATAALKERLGIYYVKSEENFWVSLWKTYNSCRFVEDEGDVVFMKDRFGKAKVRAVLETPVSDSGVDVQ